MGFANVVVTIPESTVIGRYLVYVRSKHQVYLRFNHNLRVADKCTLKVEIGLTALPTVIMPSSIAHKHCNWVK